ncbi:unnamed protein product [Penicillium nalgiovense]|nr:unnamed protein product [Penicillium nalgiovense]
MSLRGALLTQGLGCGELGNAAVSCRELGNAAVSCRELVNAAVSCGSHLSSQRPPAEFTCLVDAAPPCETQLLTQSLGCGELGNAAVSCRELVNAAVSCGSHLSSQRPPAEFTW